MGVRLGLFRPITLWPFPEQALREATKTARAVLVPVPWRPRAVGN